jgi:transposase
MGKKKDLTAYMKGKIEGLLMAKNFKNKEIAQVCDVSQATVCLIKKKLLHKVPILNNNRKNCKGVKKTTKREDRIIARTALLHRNWTLEWLTKFLDRHQGISLCTKTVRARLKKQGILHAKKTKKFILNQAMMKKRRQWAYKLRHWGLTQFSRVI